MRIGIDIDDTLTDVKDELYEACKKYAKSLGKKLPKDINLEDKYIMVLNGKSYSILIIKS